VTKGSEYQDNDLASLDSLTGLYNRQYMLRAIEKAVASGQFENMALICVDLYNFRRINDEFGYKAGDDLLRVTARRLHDCARPSDRVARMGDNEFVILLENLADGSDAFVIAGEIRAALTRRTQVGHHEIDILTSIGVSPGSSLRRFFSNELDRPVQVDRWLSSAAMAMNESKALRDGRVVVFDRGLHEQQRVLIESKERLRAMLESEEMRILFQPIMKDDRVISVEALTRFMDPKLTRNVLEVIRLSREMRFSDRLLKLMVNKGLESFAVLRKRLGLEDPIALRLNINIDIQQMIRHRFPDELKANVDRHGLIADAIYLEITERILETDPFMVNRNLHVLKDYGFRIAMDDFGSGYSSINRLINYAFDQIKLDRSFFSELERSDRVRLALKTAAQLVRSLDLEVLGEGIETAVQYEYARENRVELFQGYLFAKPMTLEDTVLFIREKGLYSSGRPD
jgi:diguanylate cyclase (GGDEF)-like protein